MDVGIAEIVLVACLVTFTAVAAFLDVRFKRIPNALTVPVCLAGLVFNLVVGAADPASLGVESALAGLGWGALKALGGFATGFGILFVLWLIGGGGGGDVKLMAALGTWLGAGLTLRVFIVSTAFVVLGMVFVLVRTTFTGGISRTQKRYLAPIDTKKRRLSAAELQERRKRRRLMPYGVPVALGTWAVLAMTLAKTLVK